MNTARKVSRPQWLEVLSTAECHVLLRASTLGRVGISVDALPVILPVVFLFDGVSIWFFTEAGTKLHAASQNAVLAFEIDDLNDDGGWSVLVIGQSFCATPEQHLQLDGLGLVTPVPGVRNELVGIPVQHVSGRRFSFSGCETGDPAYL